MLDDPLAPRPAPSWAETKSREGATPTSLPLVEPGTQACELRRERPIPGHDSGAVEIVCVAAGGKRLAIKGGDETELLATCGSCTIPRESARRPCLYLVPIKTEQDDQVRDYFICRWFYTLNPEQPATRTDWMCCGCPYWFPRPPIHILKDLTEVTQKMIRYHQDAWAGRLSPSPFKAWSLSRPAPVPRWKRLVSRLLGLVW